jgi:NADPH-dependent curcumin reductase CurA
MGVEDFHWLGNLGLTGATAYFGLLRVAQAKEGDRVFVSAAAGAVGSAVVQIAKAKGMNVVGSAGGADKIAYVREIGADAAIDYKAEPIAQGLMREAAEGIDVYFDNVGGDHLDAAFACARRMRASPSAG